MKARFNLILGRRKQYPLAIELEVYKGVDCRVYISTGVTLDSEKQWDSTRQIILRHSNAAAYNDFLKTMIQNIERAELMAESKQIAFTKDAIRAAAKNMDLFDKINVFDKLATYLSQETVRVDTLETYASYVRTFQNFIDGRKGQKKSPLYFDELNVALVSDFDQYLFGLVKPYCVSKYHFVFRKYFARAVKDGLLSKSPYDRFEVKCPSMRHRPPLTEAQLRMLEELTDEELSKIRQMTNMREILDQFLFSCYTGLRIRDSLSLLKSEVFRTAKGLVVQKETHKTGEVVVLPLYMLFGGKPQVIAEKYLNRNPESERLFIAPSVDNVAKKLRPIFDHLGFPKEFSFHTARHTCATLLAEKINDPFVIKDVLGHGNINTSMGYINNSHKTAERKLEKVKWTDNADGLNKEFNISKASAELMAKCKEKKMSDVQSFILLGTLMQNPSKYAFLKTWIENAERVDYTDEELDQKLQQVVTINY